MLVDLEQFDQVDERYTSNIVKYGQFDPFLRA